MLTFDPDLLTIRSKFGGGYNVTYYLWYRKTESLLSPKDFSKLHQQKWAKEQGGACFSYLPHLLQQRWTRKNKDDPLNGKPRYNRLAYLPNLKKLDEKILSTEDRRRWIRICRDRNLVQRQAKTTHFSMTFVFDTTVPLNLLYIHLTNVRLVEEQPDLVRAAVYCVDKLGMDPVVAIGVAASFHNTQGGHFYISNRSTSYDRPKNPGLVRVPVGPIIGLNRYLRNPEKYPSSQPTYFCCTYELDRISKVNKSIQAQYFDDPKITAACLSETDEEAQKLLSSY